MVLLLEVGISGSTRSCPTPFDGIANAKSLHVGA
jgi:hypothetical protein